MNYVPRPVAGYCNAGWFDRIPEHWSITNLRGLVSERVEKNDGIKSENYLSVMANKGVIPYAEKGDIGNKKPDDLSKCIIVHRGDFVINSMNYYIGSYGRSKFNGICSPVYIVLYISNNQILPEYAMRIFENPLFQKYAQSFGNGILEHRCSITWDILKNIRIPLPPLVEQQKIAHFLDQKTEQIDLLINRYEKLIELLEEKRQAIITRAVTKGLDPNARMKDSGVEWIGEIPEGWQVRKLRYLGTFQNGISKGGEYFGSGFPFVSYGDVYNNYELPRSVKGLVESTKEERETYSIQAEDVLFTRTSETVEEIGYASICMQTIPCAVFSGFLIRFRPSKHVLEAGFSKYYFRANILRKYFVKEMNIVTRTSLSQDLLKSLPVLLPSIREMKEITNHLNRINTQIDDLQYLIEHSVKMLREYRSSLITAAVSGQLDVSQEVVP